MPDLGPEALPSRQRCSLLRQRGPGKPGRASQRASYWHLFFAVTGLTRLCPPSSARFPLSCKAKVETGHPQVCSLIPKILPTTPPTPTEFPAPRPSSAPPPARPEPGEPHRLGAVSAPSRRCSASPLALRWWRPARWRPAPPCAVAPYVTPPYRSPAVLPLGSQVSQGHHHPFPAPPRAALSTSRPRHSRMWPPRLPAPAGAPLSAARRAASLPYGRGGRAHRYAGSGRTYETGIAALGTRSR